MTVTHVASTVSWISSAGFPKHVAARKKPRHDASVSEMTPSLSVNTTLRACERGQRVVQEMINSTLDYALIGTW